jgi:hypothetical protein
MERPTSWANWRAHESGIAALAAHEYDLHSDSEIRGIPVDLGPYRIMSTRADTHHETKLACPVAVLRIKHCLHPNGSDEDADHGALHQDEVAALISLQLGIRLQASGKTRYFKFDDSDPLGAPSFRSELETPALLPGSRTPIIAHANRVVQLPTLLAAFATFPHLSADVATALVRAARLYQEALWISEREPWLSWLLLVSAIEVAGNSEKYATSESPSDLLRELDPQLTKAAEKYGKACVCDIAKTQMKLLGATKKFLDFVKAHLPAAPELRPYEHCYEWTWTALRGPLKNLYGMRSKHLHAGIPFPWHLRGAPKPSAGGPAEYFADHEACVGAESDEVDSNPETTGPMHLHVFEHIVRGALLHWWSTNASSE